VEAYNDLLSQMEEQREISATPGQKVVEKARISR
jgi:hypothetical protein